MSQWGTPCVECGHPASYHGVTFCQVDAGSSHKRQCDCAGYNRKVEASGMVIRSWPAPTGSGSTTGMHWCGICSGYHIPGGGPCTATYSEAKT